jgi:large subunit ribosomal protein L16
LFGNCAVVALKQGVLNKRHINMFKLTLTRRLRKTVRLTVMYNPLSSITKKPSQVRMGKGKGSFFDFVYYVAQYQVIFEIAGLTFEKRNVILTTLSIACHKLPIPVRIIYDLQNKL